MLIFSRGEYQTNAIKAQLTLLLGNSLPELYSVVNRNCILYLPMTLSATPYLTASADVIQKSRSMSTWILACF